MIAQRVLFVDDDTELGNFVSIALESMGYKVHFQNSLVGIETIVNEFSPSIILLDVEIGEDNGIERAKTVLANFKHIPILFVSSHNDAETIAHGILTGGVGYIRKPFTIKELEAYVKRFALDANILYFSHYSLHLKEQKLFYQEELVKKLSKLEFKLLQLLVSHKNTALTKEMIAEVLWEGGLDEGCEASLNNLISRLRDLLSKDDTIAIETIRGKGYRLIIE